VPSCLRGEPNAGYAEDPVEDPSRLRPIERGTIGADSSVSYFFHLPQTALFHPESAVKIKKKDVGM
jgi:hypothetical protein